MVTNPWQAADWQGETWLRNHYCDGWMVCVTWPTSYSCTLLNFFHPWTAAECGRAQQQQGVESGGGMSTEAWPLTRGLSRSSHPCHHVYRTLLRLFVSVDHPACLFIGKSTHLMPIRIGLTLAIIIWRSCKMYFASLHLRTHAHEQILYVDCAFNSSYINRKQKKTHIHCAKTNQTSQR